MFNIFFLFTGYVNIRFEKIGWLPCHYIKFLELNRMKRIMKGMYVLLGLFAEVSTMQEAVRPPTIFCGQMGFVSSDCGWFCRGNNSYIIS